MTHLREEIKIYQKSISAYCDYIKRSANGRTDNFATALSLSETITRDLKILRGLLETEASEK